ncbi:RodZ domain-containing protein [Ornithinibacillus bavariensis]|uniref:helix-turn-helix domain-containing protein n=1 Tax=Ornithinibacillus bavariensis TaxID=545502 RepID=UPI003D1AA9E5
MGIGSRLRDAREAKEISLDSLQETTKIQKRYLVAIEEENFSILPGKFYTKAFIREYAIAVGLDPNELMAEFSEEIPSPSEDTTTQYTRIHRSRKDNMPTKNSAIFSIVPTLFVIILIFGIIFVVWWFVISKANDENKTTPNANSDDYITRETENKNKNTNDDTNNKENQDTDENTGDATEDTDNNDEDSSAETDENSTLSMDVVEAGTGTKPTSTIELSNVGDSLTFEFEAANVQVWLDVENGNGQKFFSGFVKPTEKTTVDMTGQEQIYLNVGSAPNLTITINDETLEYPVDPSQRGADHQKIWLNVIKENE